MRRKQKTLPPKEGARSRDCQRQLKKKAGRKQTRRRREITERTRQNRREPRATEHGRRDINIHKQSGIATGEEQDYCQASGQDSREKRGKEGSRRWGWQEAREGEEGRIPTAARPLERADRQRRGNKRSSKAGA